MAEIFLRKTLSGWLPADADAEETSRTYKVGQVYKANVTKPRSYQHHKLIMALLSLTYEHLPETIPGADGRPIVTAELWPNFTKFRKSIALEAGHTETIVTRDGAIHEGPGSLSYDALDEIEFARVSGAMMTICTQILDMSEPELAGEVSRYADDRYGRAA
jgi:hypothetical protein